ncbi:hypothetical protein SGRIM128S_03013 [Streptomyces griseomycini]
MDRGVLAVHQAGVVAQAGELPLRVEERDGEVQVHAIARSFGPVQEQPQHRALGQVLHAAPGHRDQGLGGGPLGERHGEVGQAGVQHRQFVRLPGGEPAQHLRLQQRDRRRHQPGGQWSPSLRNGQGSGDFPTGEEHAAAAGAVLGPHPQCPERRQQRARTHLRQSAQEGFLELRFEGLGGVQAQQLVQAAHQFAGAFPGEGRGCAGVALGHRLLQPAGPGGRTDPGAVHPDGVRVDGGRLQQGGAERGAGIHRGAAQHREGEGGARVPGVMLEGVQDLRGPLPRRGVPQYVLHQVRRRQAVEDREQFAAQRARRAREARRRHQSGVTAGEHGEQPQYVGGGGEPLGQQLPHRQAVRRLAHQRAQHRRLGLPDRDVLRQQAPADRSEGQQRQQVVAVLRGQRGATGQQGVHHGGGVGGPVGAQAQQAQRAGHRRLGGADGTDRPQEGVVRVDPAVTDRAARVVGSVPAQSAHQVRAGRYGEHRARLAAQHARLLRLLQQEGEDPVHVQRLGVPRHGAREAAEERDVAAVGAEQAVGQPDQARVRGRQFLGGQ